MNKKDLAYLTVDTISDVITNVDAEDLPSTYAQSLRGTRVGKEGMIIQRDFGTKQSYSSVPTVPATGSIVGGYRLYSASSGLEYDVVITKDAIPPYVRIYVNDSSSSALNVGTVNNWIELSRVFTAQINGTPSATSLSAIIDQVRDSLGVSYTLSANELQYWSVLNTTTGKAAFITESAAATFTTDVYLGTSGLTWSDNDFLVFFKTDWMFDNCFKTVGWGLPAGGEEINLDLGAGIGAPHNKFLPVEAQNKVNLALGSSSNPPVMKNLMRIQKASARNFFYLASSLAWSAANTGLGNLYVTCSAQIGTDLYMGTWGGGVYKSTDAGANWSAVNNGLSNLDVQCLHVAGTTLYAGCGYSQNDGVFKSTDGGANWTQIIAGDTISGIYSLLLVDTTLFAGTYPLGTPSRSVYANENEAGWFWTSGEDWGITYALLWDADTLYAAGNSGVYKKVGTGDWTAINTGLPSAVPVRSLVLIGSHLFAGTWGNGVYVSINGGTTWTAVPNGTTDRYVSVLTVNGTDLYAGTELGVHKTSNYGASWIKIVTEAIRAISIVGTDIFIGTWGNGVYKASLAAVDNGYKITLPANWTLSKVGGLCPYYSAKGTPVVPIVADYAAETVSVTDKLGNVFMTFQHALDVIGGSTGQLMLRVAITLEYDNYQETDPIWKGYFGNDTHDVTSFTLSNIAFNFARMNKNITAVKVYGAVTTVPSAVWGDVDADYKLIYRLPLNSDQYSMGGIEIPYSGGGVKWETYPTSEYCYRITYSLTITPAQVLGASTETLAGTLAHASDTITTNATDNIARPYLFPRFLVKASRSQAAIIIADENDATLRLSCYDGAAVHEDDNFPDISADSNGNRQRIALLGKGTLLGMDIARDTLNVFRPTELEYFDFQSGTQGIVDADFLAKDSLVKSPYGLTWAGRSGIYLLPESGGSISQINLKWANLYDGSLMTDDGVTPYVTDAYRSLITSGYDPYNKAVWFNCKMTKKDSSTYEYIQARYEFEREKWYFRKLGGSIVPTYFAQTTKVSSTDAAKLLIGYSGGILQYPNLTGAFPYQDLVTSADAAGVGYESDVTINLRELYNQVENSNLVCFMVDHNSASIDSAGMFTVEFFANDETTAFDTQYVPVDEVGEFRYVGEWGNINSLRIRLSLPTDSLSNFKKWDVSRIVLGFLKKIRTGNL